MTDAFTPLENLNLTGRYYRCLIRSGYKSIEQIEKYLAEHDEPLSKNIANMSPHGDFEIADAINYYRTGTHLPRPSGIDAMTIKKDDEIQLVRMKIIRSRQNGISGSHKEICIRKSCRFTPQLLLYFQFQFNIPNFVYFRRSFNIFIF